MDLSIPPVLRVGQLDDFREQWVEAMASGSVRLDGSRCQRIDATGLQLLWAGFDDCRSRGIPFALHSPSDDLRRCLILAGAEDILTPVGLKS